MKTIKSEENLVSKELTVIFCDRLNQIIDRRPEIIRVGRGRTNDFAAKFVIHYTTAHRLLHGLSLPSATLLCNIAETFGVTESWLLGRGAPDVDEMLDDSFVKLHIFKPRSPENNLFILFPASELPPGTDSATLLYTRTVTEKGEDEGVVVQQVAAPQEGKVHLIYNPEFDNTYLRRINVIHTRGELLCFSLETGTMETMKMSDVVFGQSKGATKTSIIGPVIARVKTGFKGD
ncbi:hypothetical protein Rfer_4270 (plasmid) [Rhodoferax ferrireducens T118]|uniref:HTH cro/C1-type domain-containing protein n=1 Tax=Albidiferax ferrireducens (strain ATCC BAA-621 / DSM 15236 / T118) TaxID=338969 RepID=Q21QI8_ALBFT|nr:helix-turn-helix transcriptional regulator [Rhodoferax ferrireducens]ABD71957.1 hypothetical protein Rfer_4270 [Rhodoferax ferrireducens T118]